MIRDLKLTIFMLCVALAEHCSNGFTIPVPVAPAKTLRTRCSTRPPILQFSSQQQLMRGYSSPSGSAPHLLFSSSQENDPEPIQEKKSNLPMLLDPGTKGGALFLSLVLFIIPLVGYSVATSFFGFDELETGKWIGAGFTVLICILWLSTYLFRVATKDMTYAQQLRDYENAVIAKRLEELDEDEVQALVEDIERDDF